MARGAPRKPTAMKRDEGTLRKDRTNPDEPVFDGVPGDAPGHLDEHGTALWREIVPELTRLGVAAANDRAMLEGLCETYSVAVKATAAIKEKGLTTDDGRKRAEVNIAKDAWTEFRRFCTEYGLTAAARSKVKASKPPSGGAKDKFFAKTG